jgi:hypothetical protein
MARFFVDADPDAAASANRRRVAAMPVARAAPLSG